MLLKHQLDIFLTALLVLLVRFCEDLKGRGLNFKSDALPRQNATILDSTSEDH